MISSSMRSTVDLIRPELMDKCNCPNQLEVMFICKDETCYDHRSQQYYCIVCSTTKHNSHPSKPIFKEVENIH